MSENMWKCSVFGYIAQPYVYIHTCYLIIFFLTVEEIKCVSRRVSTEKYTGEAMKVQMII